DEAVQLGELRVNQLLVGRQLKGPYAFGRVNHPLHRIGGDVHLRQLVALHEADVHVFAGRAEDRTVRAGAHGDPLENRVCLRIDDGQLALVVERHVEKTLVAREGQMVRRSADVHVPQLLLRARAHSDDVSGVETTDVQYVAFARRDDVVGAVADDG